MSISVMPDQTSVPMGLNIIGTAPRAEYFDLEDPVSVRRLGEPMMALRPLRGLVVIDEEHRFGVANKERLKQVKQLVDVLTMSATPIPRTLALTVYGDLDVSAIRELPAGRVPVRTIALPETRRDDVYAFTRRELDAGRQVYVEGTSLNATAKGVFYTVDSVTASTITLTSTVCAVMASSTAAGETSP